MGLKKKSLKIGKHLRANLRALVFNALNNFLIGCYLNFIISIKNLKFLKTWC
jgi:hypothetical protein